MGQNESPEFTQERKAASHSVLRILVVWRGVRSNNCGLTLMSQEPGNVSVARSFKRYDPPQVRPSERLLVPVIGRREDKVPGEKQRSEIPTDGPRGEGSSEIYGSSFNINPK